METDTVFQIAKFLTCGIWLAAGLFKITHFAGFAEKIKHFGFPVPVLVAAGVITLELVGSALVISGILFWAVALVWSGFTVWATWVEHRHVLDESGAIIFPEYVQIGKNVSLIGGLFLLILMDPSRPDWLFPIT